MTGLTAPRAQELLERANWTFAKTMPHIPHYWSVRNEWEDPAEFRAVVDAIFELGRRERFKTFKPKGYFYAGFWRYWVMDDHPKDVTLINRCDPNHHLIRPHIKAL